MVPDNSTGIPRAPAYSGACLVRFCFAYGALTLSGPAFQPALLASASAFTGPITPAPAYYRAGLGCFPFDRLYLGNRVYFLFLQVLRCFSSLRSPLPIRQMSGSLLTGCPIRISADLWVFAPPRGFSQLVTSFFASESPGIPHAPFFVPLCFLYKLTSRCLQS